MARIESQEKSSERRECGMGVAAGVREDGKIGGDDARLTEGARGESEGVREVMMLPYKGSGTTSNDGNASVIDGVVNGSVSELLGTTTMNGVATENSTR